MELTPVKFSADDYPAEFLPFISGAKLYDSSCSAEARVIFIDKDGGYFLKSAPKYTLEREAAMARYFHGKKISAEVVAYMSGSRDWLLTEKIPGNDGVSEKYLEQPERLCDIFAEQLVMLHNMDCKHCPVQNRTGQYLETAGHNFHAGKFDESLFPDNWGYITPEEAFRVVETRGHLLRADTLIHGDYCLPNIILDDWKFSGFIDVGSGGIGDRHVDLFWAMWTLVWNLKTDNYRERFIDAYGRDKVDEDMLRIVAAAEVFL